MQRNIPICFNTPACGRVQDELSRVTFGFNLTSRQGTKLRDILLSGKKVVLHGQVKGIGLEPYFMDVVVAHIRGTERPDEELVFSAHLDHPKESANDNASGSGAILDIARTLKELTGDARLPKPKRSFRFLWVPEWNGTMPYIDAHPELVGPALGGKFLANINMDMVGENLDLLHSKMGITRTPDSNPSALNDVVENMAQMVDGMDIRTPRGSLSEFNYRITPYTGGSDHMMFIDRKIPGVMFSHSDYAHHTSEDTPDKVDPVELERCEVISTGTMLYLASLDEDQAIDLVHLTAANSAKRLADDGRRALQLIAAADAKDIAASWGDAVNIVEHRAGWEIETLESVLTFNSSKRVAGEITSEAGEIQRQEVYFAKELRMASSQRGAKENSPESVVNPDKRVPVRLTRGPLDFGLPASKLKGNDSLYYSSPEFTLGGDERFELVNFIDGKRTVSEIRNALSAEFTPVGTKIVAHYVEDLVKVGVVQWN